MCCTVRAADLSNTKLYAGEAHRGDTYVHVMAYQNKAATKGPNAMILPIPAATMLGPENVIDTRSFPHFLDDIQDAVESSGFITFGGGGELSEAQVFDTGSYTVVLAERASAIARALDRVPEQKRPPLNPEILRAFEDLYAGWPLAVCCWDGTIQAEPLLWWYEPKMPDWLFAPALDAHDGGPPNTRVQVDVDHNIAFGLARHRKDDPEVVYHDRIPTTVRELLPNSVVGTSIDRTMQNGDFWLSLTDPLRLLLRRAPDADEPSETIDMSW